MGGSLEFRIADFGLRVLGSEITAADEHVVYKSVRLRIHSSSSSLTSTAYG